MIHYIGPVWKLLFSNQYWLVQKLFVNDDENNVCQLRRHFHYEWTIETFITELEDWHSLVPHFSWDLSLLDIHQELLLIETERLDAEFKGYADGSYLEAD